MTQIELEHWVCKENVDRFRLGLQAEADQRKRSQLQDMLSRELLKLQAMFPN